ncbi:hypothetical protein FACS1894111_08270 [Clostridia bacterium]|nr:hypothetical protein FACS1894111_08270 [Clostridia bacterium]
MAYGTLAIVGICIFILCISLLKQKARLIFSFLFRGGLGFCGIYFANQFFEKQEISVMVGYNPASFLTLGSLGFSGFALLYGIMLYRNL